MSIIKTWFAMHVEIYKTKKSFSSPSIERMVDIKT
jgi:hypothetical protein